MPYNRGGCKVNLCHWKHHEALRFHQWILVSERLSFFLRHELLCVKFKGEGTVLFLEDRNRLILNPKSLLDMFHIVYYDIIL